MYKRTSGTLLAFCAFTGLVCAQSNGALTPSDAGEPVPQDAIRAAIRSGISYLERTQSEGKWNYASHPFARGPMAWAGGDDYSGGLTALSLYALAASGVSADKKSIQDGVAWCKKHPEPFATGGRATYSASLLVLALTRIDPVKHKKWIHELAGRLANSQLPSGMWNYELRVRGKSSVKRAPGAPQWGWLSNGDGSNTQFAVLALWAAQATAQYRVPNSVWKKVRDFHSRAQHDNGGWSYKAPRKQKSKTRPTRGPSSEAPVWMYDPSPAMTSAGVVAYTCANAGLGGGVRGLPKARKSKVAQKGLVAFRANARRWDELLDDYYFAYSVERVGTLHALPDSAWYQPVAKRLLTRQLPDGRWRRDRGKGGMAYGDKQQIYETSLALLCLSKASRHPITPRPRKK